MKNVMYRKFGFVDNPIDIETCKGFKGYAYQLAREAVKSVKKKGLVKNPSLKNRNLFSYCWFKLYDTKIALKIESDRSSHNGNVIYEISLKSYGIFYLDSTYIVAKNIKGMAKTLQKVIEKWAYELTNGENGFFNSIVGGAK